MNTRVQEVIDSFESSFQDKRIIPFELEIQWMKKAVAAYSVEIDPISFDEESLEFDGKIDQYVIDTLAQIMRTLYQERELSKVNKRVSIVGKDFSVDGNGNAKSASLKELNYHATKSEYMLFNQMPTAYN